MSINNLSIDSLYKEICSIPAYIDPEWQAWYLAASITMLLKLILNIISECNNNELIIQKMMKQFDVNYSWAVRRLKDITSYKKISLPL
jgi:hypothetical protein